MGKRIGKLGRRGKIGLAVLITAMFIGVASAVLLDYYGKVETTATVSQSVLLDGNDYTEIVYDTIVVTAGDTEYTKHTIQNDASVEAPIQFTTTGTGDEVTIYYYLLELQTKNSATADWSGGGHTSGVPAHLKITGTAGAGDEARVHIDMPEGTKLADMDEISWWEYLVEGYPPHIDILIDEDGTADALVIEYAYNDMYHYDNEAPAPYGALSSPPWYQTFSDDGNGPVVVDDNAYAWLTSQASGPPGGSGHYGCTLEAWKAGVVTPSGTIDGDTLVTAIEIEIDNWVVQSEAYVDDIQIKGNLDPITNFVLSPLTMYGLNIVYIFDVATIPDIYTYGIEIQPVP